MMLTVYCDGGGVLGIGLSVPSGSLPIGMTDGSDACVKKIQAHCRLAYDNVTYLVPGVPEAPDQIKGIEAIIKFRDFLVIRQIIVAAPPKQRRTALRAKA